MTTTKAKAAIGSEPWILDEREAASQFVSQEAEEFTYSARNEVDWLNEHMLGIFTATAVNLTDIYKTPGKKAVAPSFHLSPAANADPAELPSSPVLSPESSGDFSPNDSPYESPVQPAQPAVEIKLDVAPPCPKLELAAISPVASPRVNVEPTLPVASADQIDPVSDGSSPIQPLMRKSSLNFASLPAREPLTTKKSIGGRTSRTSHLDQTRASYYPRHTGGKSIGGYKPEDQDDDDEDSHVELDEPQSSMPQASSFEIDAVQHHKTSTQRLQDQISMLGKQAEVRASKSIPGMAEVTQTAAFMPHAPIAPSPLHEQVQSQAPGAFPDEEEDSWIGPSTLKHPTAASPAPNSTLVLSDKTDFANFVVHGNDDDHIFSIPKQRSPARHHTVAHASPSRMLKAASATMRMSPQKLQEMTPRLKKSASVHKDMTYSPSPTRSLHSSPLKAAKDKLSAIFHNSRGLFASSAAASAEARAAVHSPVRLQPEPRLFEPVLQEQSTIYEEAQLYPRLEAPEEQPATPPKTRAVLEREERQRQREIEEKKMMDEQLAKLEKLREKELNKVRILSQEDKERAASEKEKAAAIQKDLNLKEEARLAKIATEMVPPKRKCPLLERPQADQAIQAPIDDEHMHEVEASSTELTDTKMTAQPLLRSGVSGIAKTSVAGSRITKPAVAIPKRGIKTQAPTQIRVLTGARAPIQQTTNAALSANLVDSLPSIANSSFASSQSSTRAATSSQSKVSVPSFNKSTGRKPAALLAAEKKREADEREAQRRLDLKLENQRKRAAEAEEKKQEEARAEADRKREARQTAANKKTEAQRQVLERAKNERPPPPAVRSQTATDHEADVVQERGFAAAGPSRPASRMDLARPQVPVISKVAPKRQLPYESEESSRPTIQRNGPSFTQHADKRMRTGDELLDNESSHAQTQRPNIGAPIRQSTVRQLQKEGGSKSLFSNGYASVVGPGGPGLSQQAQRILQAQAKGSHPLDMAQTSKAQINFAPSTATQASHKTPARTAANNMAKPATGSKARSSPRYQNGETIDLPEINTDESDSESDNGNTPDPSKKKGSFADWVDSPALRAGLLAQETVDPMSVFGPPQELRMEEVFRNKERWGKFRQRTSSAVWTSGPGGDALSAEEVERDRVARERLQREGGWSYGLS